MVLCHLNPALQKMKRTIFHFLCLLGLARISHEHCVSFNMTLQFQKVSQVQILLLNQHNVHRRSAQVAPSSDTNCGIEVSFNAFFKAFFNNQCGADQPGHDRDSQAENTQGHSQFHPCGQVINNFPQRGGDETGDN